jgi:hypothetical protein
MFCCIFVLGLGGAVYGAFDTVGVYDPDDDPHHNQVDQSGTYDSYTGNTGPKNVIDLAAFQALIGPAFDADAGGVLNSESGSGSMEGQDVIANFGVNKTKSVTISSTSGTFGQGSGQASGNRLPTSGNGRFWKSDTADFVFDIGPVTGGAPDEAITYFAGTLVYADHRNVNPQVTATFSGGGTVTATADMPSGAPSNSQDTFFGFAAPPGESIVNVTFDLSAYTNLDDMAFITSAFTVLSKEASVPSPAKGTTDIPPDVVLNWIPGELAPPTNGHKVYFSENFNDVNDGIGGITQSAASYTPAQRLDFGTTYYWRVDELTGPPDNTVYEGEVWNFTTELFAYAIENTTATASSSEPDKGPENTVNDSGLDDSGLLHGNESLNTMWLSSRDETQPTWIEYEFDNVYKLHEMWVWNSNESLEPIIGLGVKDAAIEHSVDGVNWTTLGTTHEFAKAPGTSGYAHNTIVDFGDVAAKYVKITPNSNWGGIVTQYGLSEVRFFYIPTFAREPGPISGATDMNVDNVTLVWRAGREAADHDVYFSPEMQTVIDETISPVRIPVVGSSASYDTGELDLNQTYYWKVNEVNEAESPATWQGDVWNFTTQEYLVVDDFESYNDIVEGEPGSNRIYNAWVDGYDDPTNGSQVGHLDPPFYEQTIVHGGNKSMPIYYDNTIGKSEATLTLTIQHDWTEKGVNTLTIWYMGDVANAAEPLYVALNGSAVVTHDNPDVTQTNEWTEWNIDLQAFADQGVNLANVNSITLGFGNRNNPVAGGTGIMYFDDIRLYALTP